MIRTATVTDVTDAGVWVVSSWLTAPTGPLAASGAPKSGDAVLVVRTDDGEMVAVSSRPAALPTSSVDNRVARFDGTGGALQGSGVTIDDNDNVTGVGKLTVNGSHPNLVVEGAASHATLQLKGAAGTFASVQLFAGSSARWTLRRSSGAESGSNTGSDFVLVRYADNQNALSDSIVIKRSTGKITFGDVGAAAGLELGAPGPRMMAGTGSPEGVVTAPVGSLWLRTNGSTGTTLYAKETGSGNTGWAAK